MDKPALLIVDDDSFFLEASSLALTEKDYDIYCADHASKALALLQQHHIGVIISDLEMPAMNGIEFFEKVRSKNPEIVRILSSTNKVVGRINHAINQGIVDLFIEKTAGYLDRIVNAVEDSFKINEKRIRINQDIAELNCWRVRIGRGYVARLILVDIIMQETMFPVFGIIVNESVEFSARFSGAEMSLLIPVSAVLAIYAMENGQGMVFSEEEGGDDGGGPSDKKAKKEKADKPKLKIVK